MSITPEVNADQNEVRWVIGTSTYPMDAIYGAAYVFLERCYVYLDKPASKQVEVVLRGKAALEPDALDDLAGEFANELLHQVLRARITKRTGKVRELIIGRALYAAEGPEDDYQFEDDLGDEGLDDEFDDYLDDPLGIAVPWEEKYGDEETGNAQEAKGDEGKDAKP